MTDTEITDHQPLELKPLEEYKILKELLEKYKKDLVHWRLKYDITKHQQVRMGLSGEDAGKANDMVDMAINRTKAEITITEMTIETIRRRMEGTLEKMDKADQKAALAL